MENLLKEKLNSGGSVFGTWSILSSIEGMMVMSSAGLDFIIIDLEHPPTSFQMAQNQVFSMIGTECTPIIRLGENNGLSTLRALETGVQSIMISHISSLSEVEKLVKAAKYYPLGERGLSPFTVHHQYSDNDMAKKLIYANEQQFIGVLVEGESGLNELEGIAKVDEIDMIYLGIYDISQALGVPGDLYNNKVKNFLKDCAKICNENGKSAGTVAPDKDYLNMIIEFGFRFISYRNDSFVLRDGLEKAKTRYEELVSVKKK